jgi:hypothetical protein
MHFEEVTCTGTTKPGFCSDAGDVSFSIATRRLGDDKSFDGCTLNEVWNSYLCTGTNKLKIGQLIMESLDGDTLDRSV